MKNSLKRGMWLLAFCALGFWGGFSGYSSEAKAQAQNRVPDVRKAMNLTTYQSWGFTVDSSPQGARVRNLMHRLRDLGFNHLTFNVRGRMVGGAANEIVSSVPPAEQMQEEALLLETIAYAHRLGFTTGLRPIVLVVGPRGEFPYVKNGVTWWHGNINPSNPARWFQSFALFHSRYWEIARRGGVAAYTIGAELHSLTTGKGERDRRRPHGYPERWVEMVREARRTMGSSVQLIYDINYTDQYILADGVKKLGGEFEQFRWDMTRTPKTAREREYQASLVEFWRSLDRIGIDLYRPLASRRTSVNAPTLLRDLRARVDSYATQLDTALFEIEMATGVSKELELKEVGYRSVEWGFLNPAAYETAGGRFSALHQALAWDALLGGFVSASWPWMKGVHVWEVNVDRDHMNARDTGFTPLGKPASEEVFARYFL
ncbi:MAG: hypothetical protein RBT63_06080 [Bdellovibrionales bacterium]|jgi:hypothetical protein|nr:hypothetical protein [Bdellovibrionales bacterium]